jgi:hypothetical protein
MTSFRCLPVALVVLASASAATSASAANGGLKLGVYDCQSYNYTTGFLDYHGSVKLKSGGKYQSSYGRHGSKLTKPHNGKYLIKGRKLKFTSGDYRKTPGKIYPKDANHKYAYWMEYVDGQPSGISCYYVPKP